MSDVRCPVCPMMDLFNKKWLHQILKELRHGRLRYSELKRRLGGVSPKTLVERLRELEGLGVVSREVFAEVPPRVEYELTERGVELTAIIEETCDWVQRWYPTGSG